MKKLLIASYDMEVGGVERSLAGMLNHFDYESYAVDLMLYRHAGEFMELLPAAANLLPEQPTYSTFRKSIYETFRGGHLLIGLGRLLSRLHASMPGRKASTESGYYQMQLMWKYTLPFLPRLNQEYDAAISYLWPHCFVADKVTARTKIAWIHTDYSTVETNVAMDLKMWDKFDRIVAVSEACKASFLAKYPSLEPKVIVMENLTSPEFIRTMAAKESAGEMARDARFKLVTVARLSHAKGIDNAVRALKLLRERGYDDIAWYVVGYGGDEAMIRGLIEEYGLQDRFILLGKQINPYPYIRCADLYVQPSRYEGKAVTVTEAKILGKPVLITDYTTSRSQVSDGVDGRIAALSAEGIADGIEELYLRPGEREKLADHCRRTDYGNSSELEKLYRCMDEADAKEDVLSAV
ncbi:glycosyltransferase involved in cell wall biosynthesis [Paenibacillus forsythiae]|uniref:Glycosyltransferase involved in cell wall biosynthesis n=1 Tax=Paenibacillus forsythiae TaxID=365616 RepID=A0ABU3HDA2_9BACL|nr:glycosyltransferase [Paenibacillus forsythiae]MDT3428802.1 glycosyltransferase involved in cell wall biosynthesis [Paenibacillus forsythiae]